MSTAASNTTSRVRNCDECGNDMPITRTNCPHCGRPQFFPNVDLSKDPAEKQKLESRYEAAIAKSKQRGCEEIVNQFATACTRAVAVFVCTLQRLYRGVASGTQLYETYHDLEQLRLRTSPAGDYDWDKLRLKAEIELLGTHVHLDKIHYACLSIDGFGLSSYGECVVQLAEPMIAHRASCFEGNSAVNYAAEHDFSTFLRCEWDNRGIICTAVFADQVDQSTDESDFPGILIEVGPQPEDDRFIEVHIFGPITARTFQSVRIDATNHSRREKAFRDAIEEKLAGVPFEVIG